RCSDGVIVSSEQCREFICRRHSVPVQRIAVIHQAAPEAYLQTPAPPMSRDRLARLLYVGHLAFFKGVHVVARVVDELLADHPEMQFSWVCDVRQHAEALGMLGPGVRSRARMIPWRDQSDLMRVYDEHGVFLATPFLGGFFKAFLEAMSRGMCVVGHRSCGMRDLIRDKENGMLVDIGAAHDMAQAAAWLAARPDQAVRMSTAARECALQFSWDRVGRETAAFYERLLDMKRGARA
ncbi:MAG TPA: glycosyltransferase family 4 protein, partial [Candidatus Brocadiia bacterium]|nr:glycosyltransferase family 4 protein [Candidatus Brocadiia bacterium]